MNSRCRDSKRSLKADGRSKHGAAHGKFRVTRRLVGHFETPSFGILPPVDLRDDRGTLASVQSSRKCKTIIKFSLDYWQMARSLSQLNHWNGTVSHFWMTHPNSRWLVFSFIWDINFANEQILCRPLLWALQNRSSPKLKLNVEPGWREKSDFSERAHFEGKVLKFFYNQICDFSFGSKFPVQFSWYLQPAA